ncbi:hypothetical protein [Klebsiella pneumoniae]
MRKCCPNPPAARWSIAAPGRLPA